MSYVLDNWSFDPFLMVALVLVGWHEIGLWRLARRSRPERTRQRRRRSLLCYAGLATLLISVASPIDYWSDKYFMAHMLQHLLLMFAAPSLVVAGAPWQPLLAALPGRSDRALTRALLAKDKAKPLRAAGHALRNPWVSVVLFSVVMIAWHVPVAYDYAAGNSLVHIWLMHGSYFAAGIVFWSQFIPSPPFRRRMPLVSRVMALLLTNAVMIALAMALSIFTRRSVYSVYAHVPGVTLPPYADQQIGAAILWVCGDFWALPAMITVVRQLIATEGSVGGALDQMMNRGIRGWSQRSAGPEAGS